MNRIAGVDPAGADLAVARAVLTDLACIEKWAVVQRLTWHARLCELAEATPSIFPEQINAATSGRSQREAERDTTRTTTLAASGPIDVEFAAGTITVDHVDVLTAASKSLEPDQRTRLMSEATLGFVARNTTPEQFREALKLRVRNLLADDGIERLVRQRRTVALRTWVDRVTGMVCYRGELDPESGSRFLGRLDAKVAELFHNQLPDTAPSDPVARQDHLRGLALVALTEAKHGHAGVVETVVVIDIATLDSSAPGRSAGRNECGWHDGSVVEHPYDGIDLPLSSLRTRLCEGFVTPVVVNEFGAVLNVGRRRRLATASQRRALRAMYPTCAVPGCRVRFDHTSPHHIVWWRHLGRTDLDNLVPLCSRHHHLVHDGGWRLDLDPITRHLTITLPDGVIIEGPISGRAPPTARAG